MNDFVSYLQAVGPFTTPVCVALTLGMWWLSRDRDRILGELKLERTDVRELRERRAADLVQSVRDYQEALRAMGATIDRLTASIRGVGKD